MPYPNLGPEVNQQIQNFEYLKIYARNITRVITSLSHNRRMNIHWNEWQNYLKLEK